MTDGPGVDNSPAARLSEGGTPAGCPVGARHTGNVILTSTCAGFAVARDHRTSRRNRSRIRASAMSAARSQENARRTCAEPARPRSFAAARFS